MDDMIVCDSEFLLRLHVADYVVQNSPPEMSFRVFG